MFNIADIYEIINTYIKYIKVLENYGKDQTPHGFEAPHIVRISHFSKKPWFSLIGNGISEPQSGLQGCSVLLGGLFNISGLFQRIEPGNIFLKIKRFMT